MKMYDKLIKRLNRYSENCVAYKLDADFADAVRQAADAIGELQKALNDAHNEGYDVGYWAGRRDYEPKWIPVTERLPKVGEEVLIYLWDNERKYIACIDEEGRWETDNFYIDKKYLPKVWMPLPEPPKGD